MVARTLSVRTPAALTIAGSDSSGGAGIQADLKTFSAFGVYGASVITALTAQNTRGVTGVFATSPEFIGQQIDAVASDLAIAATKTGMLGTRDAVLAVCAGVRRHGLATLVVDPVMVATSGDVLLADDAIAAVRGELIPLATLITPNLAEAARLLDALRASLGLSLTSGPYDADAAHRVARFTAGGSLVNLPDVPFHLWLPSMSGGAARGIQR